MSKRPATDRGSFISFVQRKSLPPMQGPAHKKELAYEVGPTGVEPARPCGHMPLKHARLPIPPRAHFLANQGRLAVYFSRRSAAVNRRNEGLQRRLH